jgi:hypothetical protein
MRELAERDLADSPGNEITLSDEAKSEVRHRYSSEIV